MKNMNKKSILLLALIVVLCTATVGGTLAYLVANTGSVVNTFEPSSVPPEIIEEFDGVTKSSIAVKNTGNIDAYIRVAIAGNWVKVNDDGSKVIVKAATADEIAFAYNTTDWIQKVNYYYHKAPVSGGETTNDLMAENAEIKSTPNADGSYLEVTVITQSIQAEPTSVVTTEWGVTLDAAGNIQ